MATALDTISGDLEQVNPILNEYNKIKGTLVSMFPINQKFEANQRAVRIPFKQYLGGMQQRVNLNGGTLANGTGPKLDEFRLGVIESFVSFQVTQRQVDIKEGKATRFNALKDIVTNAITAMIQFDETDLLNKGDGVLTNPSSAATSTTLTFGDATDYRACDQLWEGRGVDIWDTSLTTKRADGPYTITAIDWATKTVTFNAAPTGMVSTDRLTVVGLDNFTPATPTSLSSTWPPALAVSSGFTGDSWRHGIHYVNETSGYYFTKARSSYPILQPTSIDALSGALTHWHFELAKSGAIGRFNNEQVRGGYWVIHNANLTQLKQNVTSISNWNRTGDEKMLNVVPSDGYEGEIFNVADMPGFSCKQQHRDRADFFKPTAWVRVQSDETGWFKNPTTGQYLFEDRNGDGKHQLSWQLHVKQAVDYGCAEPNTGMVIKNIVPPSTGY
jgi:hypothetical protein